jgi:hypothetical protein
MPKTVEQAAAKWEAKMPLKATLWKERATAGTAHYCPEFGKFLGGTVRPEYCEAQRKGIERVSAEDFKTAVAGKGAKYLRGMKKLIS